MEKQLFNEKDLKNENVTLNDDFITESCQGGDQNLRHPRCYSPIIDEDEVILE